MWECSIFFTKIPPWVHGRWPKHGIHGWVFWSNFSLIRVGKINVVPKISSFFDSRKLIGLKIREGLMTTDNMSTKMNFMVFKVCLSRTILVFWKRQDLTNWNSVRETEKSITITGFSKRKYCEYRVQLYSAKSRASSVVRQ